MNGKAIAFKLSQLLMSSANNASHSRVKLAYSPLHIVYMPIETPSRTRADEGGKIGEL